MYLSSPPPRRGGTVVRWFALIAFVAVAAWRAAPQRDQIHRAARPAIHALERYAAEHGHYPRTLSSTGLQTPFTSLGRFRYRATDDGAGCELTVGSMFRDGRVLRWDCAAQRWSVVRRGT